MKTMSHALFRRIGPVALLALLAAHCNAQLSGEELARNDPAGEEPVSETQSALIQQNTCKSSFTFGGTSTFQTTTALLGCSRTSPGFHRGITVVSQTGLNYCYVGYFLTQNPRDGRALVIVQSLPYQSGTCTITVVENSDCAHAPCTSGVALDPTCSPNVKAICDRHASCCTNSWDSQCVSEVATIAEENCN